MFFASFVFNTAVAAVVFVLCCVGAIVSAFASSVGVLGAFIPLAVPFLLQAEVAVVGTVAALAVSSTMVDMSPYSTNGALVMANAQGASTKTPSIASCWSTGRSSSPSCHRWPGWC